MPSLDEMLAAEKRKWTDAKARGDTAAMEAAHARADALRAAGASELKANQLVYGQDVGAQRTQQYSSGYISGYNPSQAGTRQMAKSPQNLPAFKYGELLQPGVAASYGIDVPGLSDGGSAAARSAGVGGSQAQLGDTVAQLLVLLNQNYTPRVTSLDTLLGQYGATARGTPTLALQNMLLGHYLGQTHEQGQRRASSISGLLGALNALLPYYGMPAAERARYEMLPMPETANFFTAILNNLASLYRGGGY